MRHLMLYACLASVLFTGCTEPWAHHGSRVAREPAASQPHSSTAAPIWFEVRTANDVKIAHPDERVAIAGYDVEILAHAAGPIKPDRTVVTVSNERFSVVFAPDLTDEQIYGFRVATASGGIDQSTVQVQGLSADGRSIGFELHTSAPPLTEPERIELEQLGRRIYGLAVGGRQDELVRQMRSNGAEVYVEGRGHGLADLMQWAKAMGQAGPADRVMVLNRQSYAIMDVIVIENRRGHFVIFTSIGDRRVEKLFGAKNFFAWPT